MRRRALYFCGWILLVAALSGCAQYAWETPTWLSGTPVAPVLSGVDPFVQNRRLGRGINLGNALEAPYEGAWGMYLEADFFPTIAAAGFQHVRLPVRWNAHARRRAPYTIDERFFDRVDWAIEQALGQGLLVVLDFHHYEGVMADPHGHRERFLALWRQIAEHYRDYPDTLLFEVLNEPHDRLNATTWNDLLADAIAAIRESNSTRNLIVGPVNWYSIGALPSLALPKDDRHLIASAHYYNPFHFTHQGAEWVNGSQAWLGTTWQGSLDQQWSIESDLKRAARWGERRNRPIYLGEFGAYSRADMDSRARWTDFVARQAEALGMSWAYWEFGAGFGAYDRARREWRTELLHALIPPDRGS